MKIPIYQIDAFAERPFEGNPAAVCPLERWLPDPVLQSIAMENNLSETAFFVSLGNGEYHIRWFTPVSEVDLCGHATLASAYVLFFELGYQAPTIPLRSRSGILRVNREGDFLVLNFPVQIPEECPIPDVIRQNFGESIVGCWKAADYIVLLRDEEAVRKAEPDMESLKTLDGRGVIITARGRATDIVARFFAPKYGIPEDPVTGSAYTQLVPLWASRLGKKKLNAFQLSRRGGALSCEWRNGRVLIGGKAVKIMEGKIILPEG